MNVIQSDFRGGMNLFDNDVSIGDNEYALAYNVRNRKTSLDPIKKPTLDEDIPAGKKQGIYAFDKYVLAFVNGEAYYKNILTSSDWTKVTSLMLSPTVDYIYTQAVPASTFNFQRKLKSADSILGDSMQASNVFNTTFAAGLVVQDGVNQPWFILPDATASKLLTYDEWGYPRATNKSYVPIMKQMCYANGILFGISPDGKTILRSVSGRPLDFVINVQVDGWKGGDAYTTGYAVGFDETTCLDILSTGEILVGTNKQLRFLELNYTNTIFAEPTFLNRKGMAAGIVNQFSFLKYINNDGTASYYFVDLDGIRYFGANAIPGQNEGRNSTFTSFIANALSSKQVITASIVFQDYSIFSIKTIYNDDNLLAIYDNLRQKWVCLDSLAIGSIKQFAVADQSDNPVLYAITDTDIYTLYTSDLFEEATVYLKSITTGSASYQLRRSNLRTVFQDSNIVGTVSAREYVNGYENKRVEENLRVLKSDNILFNFSMLSSQCWKSQIKLNWDNGARLLLVEHTADNKTQETNIQQQSKLYANS